MSDHSEYTSSQKRPNKTEWSASIKADEGYAPGRLNKENGILESDISIYASESTENTLYILLDQYDHQHIRVIINRETAYENARVIKCKIDDRFDAEIVADTGYTIKGTLNSTSGIMYKSRHLSVDKDAEPKMCKITLPATTNQTLTFYSMYTIQKSGDKSKSFYVTYDTEYSIEINPIYGYNKGTSNHTELTMYKLNVSNALVNSSDFSVNITCTDATKKKYKITIPTMDNETVKVIANGTTYTSAVSLDYLTEYRVTITPKDNTYVPGRLIYPPVDIDSNIPTKRSFTLKEDTAIKITPVYKINDGVFYLQYLDGNKEIVPLSDYDDDDWYLKEPHLLVNLDHNNKEDLYYLPFSGTAKSGFKDIDDTNSYDYVHDKNGIVPPTLRTYTITIQQSENQIIRVYHNGIIYTNSFKVESGDNITCSIVSTNSNYAAGKLNYTSINNINQDYTISATKATYIVKKKYTITINQTSNQIITVYSRLNNQNYTSTFETTEGDYISIKVTSSTGFISGYITLDGKRYNSFEINDINSNHTISATNATALKYILNITQSNHQTITVTANGNRYTDTVSLPYGTKWTASITADTGYNAGTLSKTSGTMTDNDSISASPATIKQFTLTITQSEHQTIIVHANNKDYTNNVVLPYGTKWTAVIKPDTGYNSGRLNKYSGTITGDDSVYATSAANKINYRIIIKQTENTITTVTCTYPDDINHAITWITGTKSFPYGSTWIAYTEGVTGYTAGEVNLPSGTLTSDTYIYATSAAKKNECTLTITQSAHQTITVTANGNKYTNTVSLPYGTTYTVAIEPAEGYNAGTLNKTSGTLTGNDSISASVATIKQFTLTITQSEHQTITVTANGQNYTSSVKLDYGTKWTANIVPDAGYNAGTLNKTSGMILSDDEVYAGAADVISYTINVVQLTNKDAALRVLIDNNEYQTSSWGYGKTYKVKFKLLFTDDNGYDSIETIDMYINGTKIPCTINNSDTSVNYLYATSDNSYTLTENVTVKVANVVASWYFSGIGNKSDSGTENIT